MTNNKYKTANYRVETELEKSPEEVFNRLIDLDGWWPEDFEGNSPTSGSEFILTSGDSHYSRNKVIEFEPGKKFAWLVIESIRKTDGYEWTGTKMIFELTQKENNTLLQFTYDGVVPENEAGRLIQICDICVKELFYNFVSSGNRK